MFRLKKLWVENYKNLQDLTIDFEDGDGFSMLIGTNGSGKSNILEVISGIFHDAYLESGFSIESDYKVEYEVDGKFITINKKLKRRQFRIDNYLQSQLDFIGKNILPKNIVAIYSGEETRLWENFFEHYYMQYIRNINNISRYNEEMKLIFANKFYWEISLFAMLFSDSNDIVEFKENISIENVKLFQVKFNKRNVERSKNIILKEFVSDINKHSREDMRIRFPQMKRRIDNLHMHPSEIFKLLMQASLPKNGKLIESIFIQFTSGVSTEGLSEGEKKLILVQAILEFLADEKTLLLFDEPDSHINESKKIFLYNMFKKYKNSQIVMTTHSPTLTNIANTNEKIILQKSDDGHTSIVECSDVEAVENISGGLWGASAESIIFISQKPLILIEGSSDITCIQGAINIFSQRDRKYIDIDCEYLPMGGASNAHEFISQLKPCIASNRKVIVIFDRDEAGGKGMDACIKKGKNRRDFSTYQEGSWFYFMLPKRVQHTQDDYLLEDCFSPHKVKDIALDIVQNISGEFKKYPKDLRETIKKRLAKEITNYSESDLEGFKILLDKIHNIITDQEQCIQVPLRRTT